MNTTITAAVARRQGRFPEKLTRHYSLQDINKAFGDSVSGAVVKPVIVF